jgi:tryptophan synthase alpha chain
MNRLQSLFTLKKNRILSVYFTAGYPNLNDTASILKELENAGVDMIEIGMPFSDPLADGPVIQHSSTVALKNGMSLAILFKQLEGIRKEISIPLILMGYINPVLQYGVENFCKKCKEVGVDAVILPDLPLFEYQKHYQPIFAKYGIENVLLISPMTSNERIKQIDDASNSFIYMVSSSSTTGQKNKFNEEQVAYFKKIAALQLKNPLLVGFGISNTETFNQVCEYTCGAIVGSSFVKALESSTNLKETVNAFVLQIKGDF